MSDSKHVHGQTERTVSATIARAATISAVLRKAGHTKSVTKKSPGVKFPVATLGFYAQQRIDHVRLSSTWRSKDTLQRYTQTLTDAGCIVETDADYSGVLRVYTALA